ncbi:MAG: hypothetical protein IT453_17630 [Planctomycetes bacterium]|nr:hypothetical protein [Planctomycetota bacterium]
MRSSIAITLAGVLASAPLANAKLPGVPLTGLPSPSASRATRQDDDTQTVELRVAAQRPRGVLVDRGSVDGLAIGDRVRFRRRAGGVVDGRVVEVGERNALVALDDPAATVELGTRGEATIPSSRLEGEIERIAPATETESDEDAPLEPATEAHPPWTKDDDEWQEGEPLLARIVPLRPDERAPSYSGRIWASADEITSSEDDRTDGFERLGASFRAANHLGRGETIAIDFELDARRTDVPDDDDDTDSGLRIDRASYALGDSRFASDRVEFGRFLQRGMPEFGVLDGVEWGRRLSGGSRVGASLGYMPEPDRDFESGHDFQASAYYRWVFDESEVCSAAIGAQKTLHHGDSDRDLAIATFEYLPADGWNAHATAWVDYYTSGDQARGPGVELTQAYVRASRRFDGGDELAWTYTHFAIPDIERNEIPELSNAALADDRNDRFAVDWRRTLDDDLRLRAEAGVWSDEFESGGDGELAAEKRRLFGDDGRGELSLFGVSGRFSSAYGVRASLAKDDAYGAWTGEYEFAQNTIDGFDSTNNELPQHRLRLGRDWHSASGWSFACDVEAWLWDQETAFALHVFLQRSF